MSSTKDFAPRKGQNDLIKYLPQVGRGDVLSIQWPTGYGKSIGFALAWKHCEQKGIANRFLLVVANDTQRRQVINDFAGDCLLVGAPCVGGVWSFERSAGDIGAAKRKDAEVFVCTVQQLCASDRGGLNTIKELLTQPGTSWMIGFDEFHHYGEDMPWGDAARHSIEHAAFSMAMSATPYRRGVDTVFPQPELVVSYADAVKEPAVKPMVCWAYHYAVTVVDDDGEVTNYTTSELMEEAPRGLDAWEERKNIRYSPQYIHPLIVNPLTRLYHKRAKSGKRLQMIVRAMSCKHAKVVCDQISTFAGELAVDWIGTGENGRSDKENEVILTRFCPPKGKNNRRPQPTLDVLVQVAMAGEGFDSVNVAEIVDLFPVSKKAINGRATQDKQFYGRGARLIESGDGIKLHVNVPTDHPLHAWGGMELHKWMDASGAANIDPPGDAAEIKEPKDPIEWEWPELPKQREVELLNILRDDEHFQRFSEEACRRRGYDPERDTDELFELYKYAAAGVAKEQSAQARKAQVRDYIDGAVGHLARVKAKQSSELPKAVIGRFKRDINSSIKRAFGKCREEMDIEELETVATWVRSQIQSSKGLGL